MHHETSLKFNKQFKQNAKQQSVVTRGKNLVDKKHHNSHA